MGLQTFVGIIPEPQGCYRAVYPKVTKLTYSCFFDDKPRKLLKKCIIKSLNQTTNCKNG